MAQPKIITRAQALKKVGGDLPEFLELSPKVQVYSGDVTLATLSLDGEKDPDILVEGDLTVTGDIENLDDESGRTLIVTGSLTARALVVGGSYICVGKDAHIELGAYGHYNHGTLEVKGALRAPFFISAEHQDSFGATAETILIGTRTLDEHFASYEEILVPEVLEEGNLNHDALIKRLLAGKPVIVPGVKPKRVLAEVAPGGRVLDLRGSRQRAFPNDGNLSEAIEVLELGKNHIPEVPASVGRLTKLRRLGLRYSDTEKLDAALFALPLEELDLFGCGTRLPAELSRLKTLRRLQVSTRGGDVLQVERGALSLPCLETLLLAGRLKELPGEVATLKRLEDLDLRDNAFTRLPDFDLPKLRRLALDHLERLEHVPSFAGMPNLEELEFKSSQVFANDPAPNPALLTPVFGLSKLKSLSLSKWKKLELPDLSAFTQLRALDLGFCKLQGARKIEPLLVLGQLESLNLELTELTPGEVAALLEAMPNASLKIDFQYWPMPKRISGAPKKLIDSLDINGKLSSVKGAARLKLLRATVENAFKAIQSTAGTPYDFDDAEARYAALRYGFMLLGEPKVPAKERKQLVTDLRLLAEHVVASTPHPHRKRCAADVYRGDNLYTACAILGSVTSESANDRPSLLKALEYAERAWAHRDNVHHSLSVAIARLLISILLKLERLDEAARCLNVVVGLFPEDESLKQWQSSDWYCSAHLFT